MTGTDLTKLTLGDIEQVALRAAHSGQFGFAKPEQAYMCVLAGQEVGIPPFAAVTGIHVIQGKPVIGAGLLASLVKSSGKYDYRIQTHTDQECVIAFFEGGDHVGDSAYTMDDAKRAGLVKPGPWTNHPRNMLFARAMSNGVSWFAPDVTAGRMYVEGEIDEAPRPAPRDVVATVEVEPVARPIMADPTSVAAALKSLTAEQRDLLRDVMAAEHIDLGKTQKSAVEAICRHVEAENWANTIAVLVGVESFPDGLADVQAQHANGTPASPSTQRDKHDDAADTEAAELFGEAHADVAGVPAYGAGAAS